MRLIKLAIFLALLACISTQAQAQDLLNPMALGESMSMPLPPDLVRKAESAGVKVGTAVTGGSQSSETSGLAPVTLGSGTDDPGFAGRQPWSSAGASPDSSGTGNQAQDDPASSDVNISGMWTFTLQDDLTRHLDLALFQNGNAILGYGNLQSENSTKGVTAGGSMSDGRVNILITSQGGLSMYRLDMAPSESLLSGSYSAFTSSGDTWSGTVSGSMPGQKTLAKTAAISHVQPKADAKSQSSAKASLAPVNLGSMSPGIGSYGSTSRIGSSYSSGGMSSSQSVSMGGGGSYSSVSSISSAVYG